jgi:hypothetical protein
MRIVDGNVVASKREVAVGGGIVLVLVALSFFAGRFDAPEKVVEVEKEVEVVRVEYKDKIVEKVVTVETAAKTENRIVYVDRVVTKEGEVRERIVTKTVEVEKKTASTDASTDKTSEGTATKVVERLVEKRVEVRPDWRVGALIGAQYPPPLVPIYGPLVVGAFGERRIVGGFSVGVWLNTGGAAGISASMEF